MPFSYSPLWDYLQTKEISEESFKQVTGISSSNFLRLKKNNNSSLSLLDNICSSLGCSLSDVVKHVTADHFVSSEDLEKAVSLIQSIETRLTNLEKSFSELAISSTTDSKDKILLKQCQTLVEENPIQEKQTVLPRLEYYSFRIINFSAIKWLEEKLQDKFISLSDAQSMLSLAYRHWLSNSIHVCNTLQAVKVKSSSGIIKFYVSKSSCLALIDKAKQEKHDIVDYLPCYISKELAENPQIVFSNDKELNVLIEANLDKF